MAYIQVTSGVNYLSFDLGVYGTPLNMFEVLRHKLSVSRVVRRENWIEYCVPDTPEPFLIHWTTNPYNAMIVESIDGQSVSSLQDLYNKIKAVLNS